MLTVVPRTLALCVAACVVALLTPFAPASAGGPTSAILSVPGEGKTASLYYTDPEYDALADLVGGGVGTGVTGKVDRSGQDHTSGAGVTVTWLIHDVTPWRIDQIYLTAEGGPWISTRTMTSESGSIWDSPQIWHQSPSGKELCTLLDKLGVGQAARAASDSDGVAGAPMPAQTEPEAPAAAHAAKAAEDSTASGVWWGLGGLAGGVLLAVLWRRLRPLPDGRPAADDEPTGPGVTLDRLVGPAGP